MSKKDTEIEFEEIDGAGASTIELSGIEKLQNFFEKNKNFVFGGVAAIILLIVGGYYYKTVIQPEAEESANAEMFDAQYYFEQDSFNLALNSGFLNIIDDHSGTDAANLSHYYAGLCYFNLKNYDEAIDHIKSYDKSDAILGALAYGVLADAQMENGETDAALSNYKKAANFSDNEVSAPYLLKKAGIAFENNGDIKQALDFYKKIKNQFPNSLLATDIDKYIGRASSK